MEALPVQKGHFEIAKAFKKMKLRTPATLILNGNIPVYLSEAIHDVKSNLSESTRDMKTNLKSPVSMLEKILRAIKNGTIIKRITSIIRENIICGFEAIGFIKKQTYISIAQEINERKWHKKVLITDLPRQELVQAFMAADLFVFASIVEYSPLVLFEAAAAGTPFLSVPVGNAEEIARWTGCGEICPAYKDKLGNTRVKPSVLAKHMSRLVKDNEHLLEMGVNGKRKWLERFTWEKITEEYEKVFHSLLKKEANT